MGLAGVASRMHGGIALDNAPQAQPGVEGPPQVPVGSLDVEVVVLQGMDDLVHEGVLVVRAKLSHPYAVIFGDDIGDVLSRRVEPAHVAQKGAPDVHHVLLVVQVPEQPQELRPPFERELLLVVERVKVHLG